MIFYKKKINKETFADELGTNLAEGNFACVHWNVEVNDNSVLVSSD